MKFFFSCFFFFCTTTFYAQFDSTEIDEYWEEVEGRAFLELIPELEIGFPIGDFREGMDRVIMVGKGVSVFYRFKDKPIDLGVRFGDYSYDHLTREFTDFDGIDLVQKTKNKIWIWYGAMRIEPKLNLPFPLYFETAIGWRRYYTKSFFREEGTFSENDRFDRFTVHSEWGAVYGGAIGVKIILEKDYNTSLDIQLGFKQSGTGVYHIHNGNDEILEAPLDNLIRQRSDLSLLSLKIGLSLLGYGNY